MVTWGRVLFLFLKGPGFKFLFILSIMICDLPKVGVRDGLTKVMFLEGAEVGGEGREEGAVAGVQEFVVHPGRIFKGFLIYLHGLDFIFGQGGKSFEGILALLYSLVVMFSNFPSDFIICW